MSEIHHHQYSQHSHVPRHSAQAQPTLEDGQLGPEKGGVGGGDGDDHGNGMRAGDVEGEGLQVVTLPGSGTFRHPPPGTPIQAKRFWFPRGIDVSSSNDLYIANQGSRQVLKVTKESKIKIAGTGLSGYVDGTGSDCDFFCPHGIAVAGLDAIYVSESQNHTIRRISQVDGKVTTFAGNVNEGGLQDGRLDKTLFYHPQGLALTTRGEILVADCENHLIRKIHDPNEEWDLSTQASQTQGRQKSQGQGEGQRVGDVQTQGQWRWHAHSRPASIETDSIAMGPGDRKFVDGPLSIVKFKDVSKRPNRLYITKYFRYSPDNKTVVRIPSGLSSIAFDVNDQLVTVSAVAADQKGNIFLLDYLRGQLRRISPDGLMVTLKAHFNHPNGLACDPLGNVYIADTNNHCIRKVSPDGKILTLAGRKGQIGNKDGNVDSALFNHPFDVSVAPNGNSIYVTDGHNHAVRKIYNATAARMETFGSASDSNYFPVQRPGSNHPNPPKRERQAKTRPKSRKSSPTSSYSSSYYSSDTSRSSSSESSSSYDTSPSPK